MLHASHASSRHAAKRSRDPSGLARRAMTQLLTTAPPMPRTRTLHRSPPRWHFRPSTAAAQNVQQMFDTHRPRYDRLNHILSVPASTALVVDPRRRQSPSRPLSAAPRPSRPRPLLRHRRHDHGAPQGTSPHASPEQDARSSPPRLLPRDARPRHQASSQATT